MNLVTKKDVYPRPSAEELIYRLFRHGYFTKLDLEQRYFQILIIESDKEKTAFVTSDGHYEFNVLAQDLKSALANFQGFMSNLIATLRWNYIAIYFDDTVIFSHLLEAMSLRYFLFLMLLTLRFLLQNARLQFTRYNFLVILLLTLLSSPLPTKRKLSQIFLPLEPCPKRIVSR